MSEETVLKTESLRKCYRAKGAKPGAGKKQFAAVDDVSLCITAGRTLGLAGESGCGKSTLSRLLMRLEKPDKGAVFYEGKNIRRMRGAELAAFRRGVQIVFQDPMNSLNPRMKIGSVLAEPFRIHRQVRSSLITAEVDRLLGEVGLDPAMKNRYPHELSGGERQRVSIARAIALKPKLVICDEAVSSLDVLVRAQILNLLLKLQRDHNLAYLFISHDLHVVRHMSDSIIVMQNGRVVEQGESANIFQNPSGAYTRRLLDSINLNFK